MNLLTTDAVLTDLISGRAVVMEDGYRLELPNPAARSVLEWYRVNRRKWASNVLAPDCESLVDATRLVPPMLTTGLSARDAEPRTLRLTKIVAHQFCGLHAGSGPGKEAADYVFEPKQAITLFEGWNGSGKTSLVNAVIWCLTGQLLRPQRLPEDAAREFECEIEQDGDDPSTHMTTPITPLPGIGGPLPAPSASGLPVDTWVELTFADGNDNLLPAVRRTLSRKPSGKLVESGPEPGALGLDPVAFPLGTTMPGMLPHLQVGSSSELGIAVAKLTGLSELADLAKHAERVRERLAGPMTKDRREEAADLRQQHADALADLEQRFTEYPAMRPQAPLPGADHENADALLGALASGLDKLKEDGLSAARDVLGPSFDAGRPEDRQALEACVGPAMLQLRQVGTLPGIARLGRLSLKPEEAAEARRLLGRLRNEAAQLADIAGNPTLARRGRLYARVAAWMAEHGQHHDDACAVCRGSLQGVMDPETGLAVAEHLQRAAEDSELLAQTISRWVESWTGKLSRDLPSGLRDEIGSDLPASPAGLVVEAFTSELFATEPFGHVLATLRPMAEVLAQEAAAKLPCFTEPENAGLPERLLNETAPLAAMLSRLERALAFGDWIGDHRPALRASVTRLREGHGRAGEADPSLQGKLERLDQIVKGVAPIGAAIVLARRMQAASKKYRAALARLEGYAEAAGVIEQILPVRNLAQRQVEHLQKRLHQRAAYWRDQLYKVATTSAPIPARTEMSAKGVIEIRVQRGGVTAPAQHVANASALRAALTGFYLAFREHVLQTRGGLRLLVLDDPQDLLDADNRQRLARALASLAGGGAQIIATTYDRSFARHLVAEARPRKLIEHRSVHPVNAFRHTLETSLSVEEVDRKRQAFVDNPDSATHAQDYANEARISMEARLGDLFDDPAYPAYSGSSKATTLVSLYDRLCGRATSAPSELFRTPAVARFCKDPAMAQGADARRVLNDSHHDKASISYADVHAIDGDLQRLRSGVERVHEEFRRHRWREDADGGHQAEIVSLSRFVAPRFAAPVCEDIAAFMGASPGGGGHEIACEHISSEWFANKSLFHVRYDTLGFAVPSGSLAIAEAEPAVGSDHDLVVARKGAHAFARRLVRPKNGGSLSLVAESPDSRRSRPTLAYDQHGLQVHRIVGVLFSRMPPPEGREEATQVASFHPLAAIEVAYKVREESALPLASPGQIILGGRILPPSRLGEMKGELVAVTLDDGTSILKRVGSQLPGKLSHLRQFETIGGLGSSVVLATERFDGVDYDLPLVLHARPVIGVLYEL